MYFNIMQNIIENFLDYYYFDFELPEFDINDDDFEQKEPVISYYKKHSYADEDDDFVKVIII
tara:strand:+ start:215 stop:400 length:186 start_codon:yes stop_codon:yes gene_type:complete